MTIGLTVLGILLIALSGFEKIMIYISHSDKVGTSMDMLVNLTPEYIWSITNYTFYSGVTLFLVGIISYLYILTKKNSKISR